MAKKPTALGGGGVNSDNICRINNCTFAFNTATNNEGAGLYWDGGDGLDDEDRSEIANSIFYFNGDETETAQIRVFEEEVITAEYCIIQDDEDDILDYWDDASNSTDNPQFVNDTSSPYDVHLSNSDPVNDPNPCIDSGDTVQVETDCIEEVEDEVYCIVINEDEDDNYAGCDVDDDGCTEELAPDITLGPRERLEDVDRGAYEFDPCPGDVAGSGSPYPDGQVDVNDMFFIFGAFGQSAADWASSHACDVIYPGTLAADYAEATTADWFVANANWGSCTEEEFSSSGPPEDYFDCATLYGDDEEMFLICLEAVALYQQYFPEEE